MKLVYRLPLKFGGSYRVMHQYILRTRADNYTTSYLTIPLGQGSDPQDRANMTQGFGR